MFETDGLAAMFETDGLAGPLANLVVSKSSSPKKPRVPSIFGQMMHDGASSLRSAAWGATQEMMREDR